MNAGDTDVCRLVEVLTSEELNEMQREDIRRVSRYIFKIVDFFSDDVEVTHDH